MPDVVPSIAGAALLAATGLLAFLSKAGASPGWSFVLQSPERWLAVVGLGSALGAMERDRRAAAISGVFGGFVLGIAAEHSSLWAWLASVSVYPRLHLLGPFACLLSGLLLVLREPWRSRASPFVALGVAMALTIVAGINDPGPDAYAYVGQAGLASLWLMLVAAFVRRLAGGAWISLGERIAGSWLLTIGLLLAGAQFVPPPGRRIEAARPIAPPASPSPVIPDVRPALRPDGGAPAFPFGDRALPRGTN